MFQKINKTIGEERKISARKPEKSDENLCREKKSKKFLHFIKFYFTYNPAKHFGQTYWGVAKW